MRDFRLQRAGHVSLCEALDRVLDTGVVALGEATLSVAGVDLIYLGLQLVVTSVKSGWEPASANAGPPPGPDWRGGPRRLPGEETPAIQAIQPPPGAALPPAPACRTGLLCDGAPGGKTASIASALAGSNRQKNGLGQLVLTLMKVLHELLKRQALRRIEGGALTPAQIERLGMTFLNQAREIDRLRKEFGLPEESLNLDLGPLGKLL